MYQTRNDIYVWLKSDDGKKVESHKVQGWYKYEDGGMMPVIFDEITGIKLVSGIWHGIVRFSLDERDNQPLMLRSVTPAPPSAPTAAVNIAALATDPNARVEFETDHSRRAKANALPHEKNCFREGLVEA